MGIPFHVINDMNGEVEQKNWQKRLLEVVDLIFRVV